MISAHLPFSFDLAVARKEAVSERRVLAHRGEAKGVWE